jgi:hypothetical protein
MVMAEKKPSDYPTFSAAYFPGLNLTLKKNLWQLWQEIFPVLHLPSQVRLVQWLNFLIRRCWFLPAVAHCAAGALLTRFNQ